MWADAPRVAKRLYRDAVKNARVRGIEFELGKDEFGRLWAASGARCAITGRPLDIQGAERGSWRRNPWAPSLDRISSADGYRAGNCRVVCVAANIAMNEWGLDVLRELAHGLFGSDPQPRHSRSGSGCLKGISRRNTRVGLRFVVRIQVQGSMREFGSFRDYEKAVHRLQQVRDLAVESQLPTPRNQKTR